MTKREAEARARRVAALAAAESNIHERLIAVRDELALISAVVDRVVIPRRPRLRAGADLLGNLIEFRRRKR